MDEPHHRALAHGGGDSLDRATAHVARCEYTRQARLQEVGLPRELSPDARPEREAIQRPPRQDEAALVELDGAFKPTGVRLGSDEDEERFCREGAALARPVVLDEDAVELILSQ